MLVFILHIGLAWQCLTYTGKCVQVPYEAVANMVQFGFLELLIEIGGYRFYKKLTKKKDKDKEK